MRTETEVSTRPERKVAVIRTSNVEAIRIRKSLRIAICGAHNSNN
jgi:hypothetical protein